MNPGLRFRVLRHPVLQVFFVLLVLTGIWYLIDAPIGLITQIAIYTLYGSGVCMLVSYTGLVPFGASVFFGCASYAVAFVMLRGAPNEIVALLFCVAFSLLLACCHRADHSAPPWPVFLAAHLGFFPDCLRDRL